MNYIKKLLLILSISSSGFIFALEVNDHVRDILKNIFPNNPVILEVGAYMGGDTIQCAKLWPNAMIYTFEPVPYLFTKLKSNTNNFPNVHCYQLALNNTSGISKFYLSSGSSEMSGSLLKPKEHLKYHPDVFFTQTIDVLTMNLDEWALQNNVDHIDIMWLTMQGSEIDMLKAAPHMLKAVQAIYTEVHKYEVYSGCLLYPEMKKWFESQGFVVVVEELNRWSDFGNALFIRKK